MRTTDFSIEMLEEEHNLFVFVFVFGVFENGRFGYYLVLLDGGLVSAPLRSDSVLRSGCIVKVLVDPLGCCI